MHSDVGQFLAQSVSGYEGCVDWEGSHHADDEPLVEGPDASHLVVVLEHAQHVRVLVVSELVRLHHRLHVVERIVQHPV